MFCFAAVRLDENDYEDEEKVDEQESCRDGAWALHPALPRQPLTPHRNGHRTREGHHEGQAYQEDDVTEFACSPLVIQRRQRCVHLLGLGRQPQRGNVPPS